MVHTQMNKYVCMGTLGPIATDATSNHYVDTKGWDHALIMAIGPAATAAGTSKWTSMVLSEATITNISSATAITGCTGTTNATAAAGEFVLPGHSDTSIKSIVAFDVSLPDKQRYLHLTVESATAAYSTCAFVAVLSRGDSTPDTDAEMGMAEVVYV